MAVIKLTGREKGKQIIIGGTSPHGLKIAESKELKYPVIGLNNWPVHGLRCDYWLTCDTHRIDERMPDALPSLAPGTPTFFNRDWGKGPTIPEPSYWFARPPETEIGAYMQPQKNYPIPGLWSGHLQHIWTSATAAANLAYILGASSIILLGVDLLDDTNFLGSMVPWARFAPDVAKFFRRLPIPVYMTHPASPLKLPMWSF